MLNLWFVFSFNNIFGAVFRGHLPNHEIGNSDSMARSSAASNVVSTMCLCFHDPSWEWAYMCEPDLMLKYSTLMGFVMFVAILLMQTLNGS